MKTLTIILSFFPLVITFSLFIFFLKKRVFRTANVILTSVMAFGGIAFPFFMNAFYRFIRGNTPDRFLWISLFAAPLTFLICIMIKDRRFSVKNILPNLKEYSFPAIAIMLYIESMNAAIVLAQYC